MGRVIHVDFVEGRRVRAPRRRRLAEAPLRLDVAEVAALVVKMGKAVTMLSDREREMTRELGELRGWVAASAAAGRA